MENWKLRKLENRKVWKSRKMKVWKLRKLEVSKFDLLMIKASRRVETVIIIVKNSHGASLLQLGGILNIALVQGFFARVLFIL